MRYKISIPVTISSSELFSQQCPIITVTVRPQHLRESHKFEPENPGSSLFGCYPLCQRFWKFLLQVKIEKVEGSRGSAVVRTLASHQCVLGLIPRPGVICGLSLLLVLTLAPRVFLRFSSLLKNQLF